MNLSVLPLAITMMAGPQIISALIIVTTKDAVRSSLAFVAGVAVGVVTGVTIAKGIASLLGNSVSLGNSSRASSTGNIIQYVLVGLLVLGALKNYRSRHEAKEPPKWLTSLMTATPATAFKAGLFLILVFPSDVIVMLTVGLNLEQANQSVAAAIPFLAATVFIAALPLLTFVLFRRRAEQAMPQVRDWVNAHTWLVNIIVCVIFIVLILG